MKGTIQKMSKEGLPTGVFCGKSNGMVKEAAEQIYSCKVHPGSCASLLVDVMLFDALCGGGCDHFTVITCHRTSLVGAALVTSRL